MPYRSIRWCDPNLPTAGGARHRGLRNGLSRQRPKERARVGSGPAQAPWTRGGGRSRQGATRYQPVGRSAGPAVPCARAGWTTPGRGVRIRAQRLRRRGPRPKCCSASTPRGARRSDAGPLRVTGKRFRTPSGAGFSLWCLGPRERLDPPPKGIPPRRGWCCACRPQRVVCIRNRWKGETLRARSIVTGATAGPPIT